MDSPADAATVPWLAPTAAALGRSPRAAFDRLGAMSVRAVQLDAMQEGLRPGELSRSARRDLLATLGRRGLAVAGLDAWVPAGDLADAARVERALALVRGAIALAEDLRRCPVSLILPAGGEDRADPEPALEIIACAARRGVRLADHAVPFFARGEVGLGIDPAAWLSAGRDPVAAVLEAGNRLVSARLCDLAPQGRRVPIGARSGGRLDALAYRQALQVAGCRHPVVVDLRWCQDPWRGLARTIETWR